MLTFSENKLNCFEMKILEINLFQEEEKIPRLIFNWVKKISKNADPNQLCHNLKIILKPNSESKCLYSLSSKYIIVSQICLFDTTSRVFIEKNTV